MQNMAAAQSPPFGYLSPPIDGCDVLSEDGDTLQTPLTGHVDHYQPYAVHHQNKHAFSHSYAVSPDSPNMPRHDNLSGGHDQQHCAQHDNLLKDHQVDRLGSSLSFVDTYFSSFTSPAQALDLANASLEYNPFAASFGSAFEANSFFGPNSQPFPAGQDTCSFPQQLDYPEAPTIGPSNVPGPCDDHLSALPSLSVSMESFDSHLADLEQHPLPSLLLEPVNPEANLAFSRPSLHSTASQDVLMTKARMFSPRFPAAHYLNPFFAGTYILGDELGAGGYGFVMTARHRVEGYEVAVKFIIKSKVPEHAWWDDELLGHVPTEIMIMSLVNHDNIVRCLDLFEDELYFYLVQELHGTPWISRKRTKDKQITAPSKLVVPSPPVSTPLLTPSPSTDLAESLPATPPQVEISVHEADVLGAHADLSVCAPQTLGVSAEHNLSTPGSVASCASSVVLAAQPVEESDIADSSLLHTMEPLISSAEPETLLQAPSNPDARPNFSRRPSYDLFECIEQSKHKRLSENNARYVFAQIVEAVYYLDTQGITHCDIKDENLVIDADFKVKLIDFGSAVVADPTSPRPFYNLFFGTTAYASSEVLLKKPYQAPPAEIWTLGVLLSYLLTGHSPFPTEQDAIDGRMVVRETRGGARISRAAVSLMARCLERDPERRADIAEVRGHRWLQGALERSREQDVEEGA